MVLGHGSIVLRGIARVNYCRHHLKNLVPYLFYGRLLLAFGL
ncbi:MAG: hypothetical protein OJF50_001719 [Nitrospira sp.]|nr:hypothetical protein [Nitrospira sp.]